MTTTIKSCVLGLLLCAVSFGQSIVPYNWQPRTPSPNAPSGSCFINTTPVYNYILGTYWYCLANTSPPIGLGTWTSYTPPSGVLAGSGATITAATAAQIATALSVPASAVVLGSNSSSALVAATVTGSGTTAVLGTSPAFTTDIHAATAAGATLGTAALPFSALVFGSAATNVATITPATFAAARAITLADPLGADTIAYLAATQTFTNKTLTAPTLTAPVLGTVASGNVATTTGQQVVCGATAACPSTSEVLRVVTGTGTLSSGSPSTYAVTTISPAFTSASTFTCTAQDTTTIANNIGVLAAGYVSGSAVTFSGPNTNTDGLRFVCIGY